MSIFVLLEVLAFVVITQCILDLDLYDFESPQTKGYRIIGVENGDSVGASINYVGDVNNDGISDIIVKARSAEGGTGVSYVIFGHEATFNFANINLDDMVTGPTTGFRLVGAGGDSSTRSVAAVGDVNNDGIDDFMIGAPQASEAYVIYGTASAAVQNIYLNTFTSSPETGFKIIVDNGVKGGWCVSLAGDINGDNIQDLIVTDQEFNNYQGVTYIIFGNYSHVGDLHTNSLTETGRGFRIYGSGVDNWSGNMAVDAGDVNGDGVDDIIIAAPFTDLLPVNPGIAILGITYVIFGRNTSVAGNAPFVDMNLIDFISSNEVGYRIVGENNGDRCGWSVSGLGDINGDNYADIIVSIWGSDTSYVILGHSSATGQYEDIELGAWYSTYFHLGFRLVGAADSVSSAGDVNGDGYDDILCSIIAGDFIAGRPESGIVYLIYGRPWVFPYGDILLGDLMVSETTGFRIIGAEEDHKVGLVVASAGDHNNDGYDDMMVSTPNGYHDRGGVFIVFGQPSAPTSQPSTQPTSQPSRQPVALPSGKPTNQPTGQPTLQPTSQPLCIPSAQPSRQPSSHPSGQPSAQPSFQPSVQPSGQPSLVPSKQPSSQPSGQPSGQPSLVPTEQPSSQPSGQPLQSPTSQPSVQPTRLPSTQPSTQPSRQPSLQPVAVPSAQPSRQPSAIPSRHPLALPTGQPSQQPSTGPSAQPSRQPSSQPSVQPSASPTVQPTQQPSSQPSVQPSALPTCMPSMQPTGQPSMQPTEQPSIKPSGYPSRQPSAQPSCQPSLQPSCQPSARPSAAPSGLPSVQPSMQPTSTPTSFPSSQPSRQPSSQPTMQPSRQPSTQPSLQPSIQPTRQPTGQPTHAPTVIQITSTGEWSYALNASITSTPDAVSVVGTYIWVCGGALSILCALVDTGTGLLTAKYALPWKSAVTVLTGAQANSAVVAAVSERSGVGYSEIATCDSGAASLLCSVLELSDTTFVAAITVPYTQQRVYMGQYNALPSLTIVDPSTSGSTGGAVRSYVYTPSAVRSMQLTCISDVPNFAGAFLAGTGTVLSSSATVPVIVAGWVSTSSGVLSAMYLSPFSGVIGTDIDLVNVITMASAGPDSFIAGGLQVGSGVKTAFLVRINALYRTASFGVRYVRRNSASTLSVVKGMVSEGSVAYLLLASTPLNGLKHIVMLRVNAATGAITRQTSLSVTNVNVSCTSITSNTLSLVLSCTTESSVHATPSSVVLATNRDLSFKRLPNAWIRNSTISFTAVSTPFVATSFATPTASKVIPTSNFAYSTSGQAPSWRPTTAPTIKPSARPSMRPSMQPSSAPSGQPSSSPTAAPSISPRPTSQPSTGGPTNTNKPSGKPTLQPSPSPTLPPTVRPSARPTVTPTTEPTVQPSADPSVNPSFVPSVSPTQAPTIRPTRAPIARPSRPTTAAPTVAGGVNDDTPPTEENVQKKQGDMTQEVVIGVAAAGGVLGFGIVAISLCALCSYKLRKNREKYVQSRKTLLPVQRRKPPAHASMGTNVDVTKSIRQKPPYFSQQTLQNTSTHSSASAVQIEQSSQSDVNVSDQSSSIELSSLHSSEMSDFEYDQSSFTSSPSTSVRRLSEMEAQRTENSAPPALNAKKGVLNRLFKSEVVDSDDDSSIERGFNEIMAEFSDDSSWDSSA